MNKLVKEKTESKSNVSIRSSIVAQLLSAL